MQSGKRLTLFSCVALLFAVVAVSARAREQGTWPASVEQWGIEEIVLSSDQSHANPFTDVKLQGVFRAEGRSITVEGFYDGSQTWKLRFMPPSPASWTFRTVSNDPKLNGIKGQFTVGPPLPGNHGPIGVVKTFHFSYADGTPFFPLGTTSYNWLNRDDTLQEQTVASIRNSGFDKLRFGLFPKWYKFNRVDPVLFPYPRNADGAFDLERFDPAFFANVEKRLRELAACGVEADIILFHPYDRWGFSKLDEAHGEAYLHYVIARLAAFRNVWWTMANEYDFMPPPHDWDRLTQTVRNTDPYKHPLGIHNAGAWYDHGKPWIDHVVLQDGSTYAWRSASIARQRYRKPVVVDEYGYEGNNSEFWGELTGEEEVSRHWDITMAGAYASHGETYVNPGGILWWAAGGTLQGESPARLKFLKSVTTSLPFQDMAPSPELVVNGSALALTGKAYLFRFVWGPKTFIAPRAQVRLAGSGVFKVELIDPWRMQIYPLGYTNPGDQAFSLPMLTALFRITAVDRSAESPRPIADLLATFAGEPNINAAADPSLFKKESLHYSADFQISQLQQNSAANAVLEKYVPKALLGSGINALPLDIAHSVTHTLTEDQMRSIQDELQRIPVE
jgi:hypothetical protein